MAKIRVAAGVTKNLGDYNSLRLDASYEDEVDSNGDIDAAYAALWAKVEKQIEDKLAEYELDD